MINFPEISMWGRRPWGGYGANPFPGRVSRIWSQAADRLDGGFPYSEGRFEDINKVICLALFWDKGADWREILRAYTRYEFSPSAADDVSAAIALMEETYPLEKLTLDKAKKALALLDTAADGLPSRVLESWRWRLLYLRAIIDVETATHPGREGVVSDRQQECFEELTGLYCAQQAEWSLKPPSR